MDKFKKDLQTRIRMLVCYNSILIIMVSFDLFHPTAGQSEFTLGFMSGVNVGLYIAVQALLIYLVFKYQGALRKEDKLRELYIYENDERCKYIRAQIGGVGINIILGGLAIGTIISGFYNEIVFFVLLSTLMFSALVKGILKVYFNRKV